MGGRVRFRETGKKQTEEKMGMIFRRKKNLDYMENEFRRKTRGLWGKVEKEDEQESTIAKINEGRGR